jgi:hypothetical protein
MPNKEALQKKMIWNKQSFLPPFNTIKPQIGWNWVNRERKIRTRVNKKIQKFEELIRNSNFFMA